MPELPEVEVVRLGLAQAVTDAVVARVEVFDERGLTRHPAGAADFAAQLEGAVLAEPRRRGKFLWVPFASSADAVAPRALMTHLGMSGQMLLREPGPVDDRHLRVRIGVEGPAGRFDIAFVDQRTFGSLAVDRLISTPDVASELVPSQALHIARDPLDPYFQEQAVIEALRRRRSPIKAALLDQTLVSGIGNIYADESLWMARLNPRQPACTISTRKLRELLGAVRLVLEKALAEGGTSFDAQYVNVNGQAGYFAHSLHAYGRHGKPCDRCGRALIREQFQNRNSHFCPKCQRLR
ncbi:bifunctional DNA-formamidopyrimidine glycosylase/DNA-(apurinic or apyrimidinic site) lyase [Pseudoclavibacter alba]|uniref:Formamidopyrimidine-DNA glycosylase n=1 Tax=Pseudoclavibacter albus TaxID=272241 RepID=A0ABT2HUP1_9MICO|nr:bifunctional DNA-formamidopyrimidine glycosylase/DNA-(apurinic or apyrimidinic site) lyase [Pseudoclavibacter alba]MCT2041850.1 bifunctional DNA-formamidopyrimidine glycosylase/DNA-(apurinic or apyrimidinic site) lyase [Pseudoclavibacter alba]